MSAGAVAARLSRALALTSLAPALFLAACAARGPGPNGPIAYGSRAGIASGAMIPASIGSVGASSASAAARDSDGESSFGPPRVVRSPWSLDGAAGETLQTDHFIIHTTDTTTWIGERLPAVMEAACATYRTALVDLPPARTALEMFVLASRAQWQALTLRELGGRGHALTRMGRGGFTFAGRAFLFDIGAADTMSLASHEGWHQFTQRSFAEPLPIWAEEGIATYMEGHRWRAGGGAGGTVTFNAWNNPERFDRLREAEGAAQLIALEMLLASTPEQMIGRGEAQGITYYAQVWALVHFLNEGEGGKYRAGFQRLIRDASSGALGTTMVAQMRSNGSLNSDRHGAVLILARSMSAQVFRTYITPDIAQAEGEYRAFVRRLVAPGSKQKITQGVSPTFEF
ncbi:hypothetical protein BH11PLA1_BH11PLA1_02120 [soil metagenome]